MVGTRRNVSHRLVIHVMLLRHRRLHLRLQRIQSLSQLLDISGIFSVTCMLASEG